MTRSVEPRQDGYVLVNPGTTDLDKLLSNFGPLLDAAAVVIVVSPSSASVGAGGTQAFTAQVLDRAGVPLTTQPTFIWAVSGTSGAGMSIDQSGNYVAGSSGGSDTVMASALGAGGVSPVTVPAPPPTIYTGASYTPNLSNWTYIGSVTLTVVGNNVSCDVPGNLETLEPCGDSGLDGVFNLTGCSALTSLNMNSFVGAAPPVLTGCAALQTLNLDGCCYLATPPVLTDCISLTSLDVSHCPIWDAPRIPSGCTNINSVNMSFTDISNFDQVFADLAATGATGGTLSVYERYPGHAYPYYTDISNADRAALVASGWTSPNSSWDDTAISQIWVKTTGLVNPYLWAASGANVFPSTDWNAVLCDAPANLTGLDTSGDSNSPVGTFNFTGCTALQTLHLNNLATLPDLTGLTNLTALTFSGSATVLPSPYIPSGCTAISHVNFINLTGITNFDSLFADLVAAGTTGSAELDISGNYPSSPSYTSASNSDRAALATSGWSGNGWDNTAL